MYRYFFSYFFVKGNKSGYGNATITWREEIKTDKDIREIEKAIINIERIKPDNIVILNFILLEAQ